LRGAALLGRRAEARQPGFAAGRTGSPTGERDLRGGREPRYDEAMRWRADLFGGPRDWARRLTIATLAGVFLGLIGPFGTWESPGGLAVRIAYWTSMFWTGSVIFGLTVVPATVIATRLGFPRLFSAAAASIGACIPVAALVALIARQLWPGSREIPPLSWYGYTLLVSLPLAVGYAAWRGSTPAKTADRAPSSAPSPEPAGAGFLSRLPPQLGRDLLCLQMEDHYVRAHTPLGSALVLLPLKDAIAELGDAAGLRVHRSWWVARSALERPVSDGRNLKLRLVNGLEVPVARSSVAEVRAAGWLG
jgi:hypothetical protein